MEKKIIITLLLSILIISCSDTLNESQDGIIQLSDTTQIYFKQTLFNFKESLSIQFDNLVSDSRCPIDAICVWEGDAEVRFKFKIELQTHFLSLHTSKTPGFRRDTTLSINYKIYNIEMVELKPYPQTNIVLKPEDYKASIVIKKTLPIK